jgi:Fe2+ or Zn2+ uptake regulation protein
MVVASGIYWSKALAGGRAASGERRAGEPLWPDASSSCSLLAARRSPHQDTIFYLTSSQFRLILNTVKRDFDAILREKDIQASAQRVAVARYVLASEEHPSADRVFREVKRRFPYISRATVYNTLNLFVEKGLLRALTLAEDSVVFDPKIETHHHFIDETTGQIHDVPWDRVQVCNIDSLREYEIHDYQVVMRGVRKPSGRA